MSVQQIFLEKQNETNKNLFCHQKRWNDPLDSPGYGPEVDDDDDDNDDDVDNDDKFLKPDTLRPLHSKSS